MTSSPEPQDSRRRLTWDEWIAIIVALTGIGSVFWWVLRPQMPGWSPSWVQSRLRSESIALNSPVPTVAPVTTIPSPVPIPKTPEPEPSNSLTLQIPSPALALPKVPTTTLTTPEKSPAAAPPAASPIAPAAPQPAPSAAAPTVESPGQPKNFSDVPVGFWASPYIVELSKRGVLTGFADNTFQPNQPITRAEFASMVQKAFEKPKVKPVLKFSDIPANYGGAAAIDEAIQTGFMSGYPKGLFKPDQQIPRLELQVALATGLKLPPAATAKALAAYTDASAVPKWATDKLGAAIAAGIVVKDADANQLKAKQVATRADAAALIYQALAKEGKVKALSVK